MTRADVVRYFDEIERDGWPVNDKRYRTRRGIALSRLRHAVTLRLCLRELHRPARIAVLLAQLCWTVLPFIGHLARLDGEPAPEICTGR